MLCQCVECLIGCFVHEGRGAVSCGSSVPQARRSCRSQCGGGGLGSVWPRPVGWRDSQTLGRGNRRTGRSVPAPAPDAALKDGTFSVGGFSKLVATATADAILVGSALLAVPTTDGSQPAPHAFTVTHAFASPLRPQSERLAGIIHQGAGKGKRTGLILTPWGCCSVGLAVV